MIGPRISIAILAMGGEGGGVLSDWLVDLAEHNGYVAQATSVPGVAQRTGATIYYLEMYPRERIPAGTSPVLALSPFPGEVDLVVASELMEAGRALQRGLVHPERTTLVASTHRVFSMTEKMAMADGRVSGDKLLEGARAAARQLIAANFADIAERAGTPIGASLFGAVAAAGCLPFSRAQFEAAIERGGVGVAASLKAFSAGHQAASQAQAPAADDTQVRPGPRLAALDERITSQFKPAVHRHLRLGITRLADYQDEAYAGLYLDRLQALQPLCGEGAQADELMNEAARHLALWMSYEDVVRVADLKTRRSRFARVHQEVRAQHEQLLQINEFLHPRLEEIADTLPASLGRWLLASPRACRLMGRWLHRGRIVQTTSLRGYLQLYLLASLRRWRTGSLRYAMEQERMGAWLDRVRACLPAQPQLALEIVRTQQLIKGYSDTHQRGWHNFSTLMDSLPRLAELPHPDQRLAALRQAALADESGQALKTALHTHLHR